MARAEPPGDAGDGRDMDVTVADTMASKTMGYIGNTRIAEDEALVFPYRSIGPRLIHMLGVRCDLGVIWAVDGTVVKSRVLRAWWGVGMHDADLVVECHPALARSVDQGDDVPPEIGI